MTSPRLASNRFTIMPESVKELHQPTTRPTRGVLLWSIHRIAARVRLILGFGVLADSRNRSTIVLLSIMGSMVLTGMLSCASYNHRELLERHTPPNR